MAWFFQMGKRSEFSRKTKLAAWERAGGGCEECGKKLFPGDRVEYDHIITCEQGGDNSLENCAVLCRDCHVMKTAIDAGRTAKTRSVRAKHTGAHQSKHVIPGSRRSGWKIKLDGTVVRRDRNEV